MKNNIKKIVFSLLVLLAVMTAVCAHSGRTDSAGGHMNHSSGEYHYHHGYDDHQHYDMNGDGVSDCPYKFKDSTTHKESSYGSKETERKVNTSAEKQKKSSSLSANDKVIGVVFVLAIACVVLYEVKK